MSLPVSLPDVAANNFISASVFLFACWYLPGMAWEWLLACRPGSPSRGGSAAGGRTICWGRDCSRVSGLWTDHLAGFVGCLVCGLPAALLVAGLLAAAHRFRPGWMLGAMLLVTLAGLILGGLQRAPVLARRLRLGAPGGLLFMALLAAVLLPPRRGEWIAGGWDPGVYVNTGVAAARQGGFGDWPLAGWTGLSAGEMELFARRLSPDYAEWFPGAPVAPVDRACRPYFFPATPLLVGTAFHAGGLRAATRAGMLAGVLAAPVFLLLARGLFGRWPAAGLATLLLALHPLFLYHLHTPVSEMLELFAVVAAGWLLLLRRDSPGALWPLAGMLLLGVLNRISFAAPAALFVLAVVVLDRGRPDRRRAALEHGLLLAAIIAGVVVDLAFSGMVPRLRHVLPLLLGLTAALLGAAALADAMPARRPRPLSRRLAWAASIALGLAGLALLGYWANPSAGPAGVFGSAVGTVRRMLPFLGWAMAGFAGLGLLAVVLDRRAVPVGPAALGFGLCLLAACLALLPGKWIAELYPWATRRFLACGLPLLALLATYAVLWLRARLGGRRFLAQTVLVAALAGLIGSQWPQRLAAWRCTEYDGLSAALAKTAAQIAPGDIVVADHFAWAMPLAMIYGRRVVNGSGLWERPEPGCREKLAALADRLSGQERRLRFLTSTPRGMEVWGPAAPAAVETWRGEPVALDTVIHSPRAASFAVRPSLREFRLHDRAEGGW